MNTSVLQRDAITVGAEFWAVMPTLTVKKLTVQEVDTTQSGKFVWTKPDDKGREFMFTEAEMFEAEEGALLEQQRRAGLLIYGADRRLAEIAAATK